ncbi:hypothetical protein [Helicobacter sp.]|uniref:hypothetical protein n=1 Tax=Helicobacter sp. TaxID=218 RepID=UPI002A74A1DC|nr:hypothetical protein [Helicobacter sp.]MDY2585453.1 hypothetical protein [Helicobacter sp.]
MPSKTDSTTTSSPDSTTISELLNKDILNTLANSPEFVAELKEMLVLNTALLKAFETLKAAFENNLNFTQEHAQKLSDISTRFEADFANFKLENAETNTRIDAYLLDLQTLMQESRQNLASATNANAIATQNIQSLEVLTKVTSLEGLEEKVNRVVDVLNADENELLKCCKESVTKAQEQIQTILKHSLAHLETTQTTTQTTLEQEAQKVVAATDQTLQESLKTLRKAMANDVSVQGIIAKIEELQAKIETFAQEMLARQAQNGMGAIDNVGSPAHLFAKIETFAQEMLARQAQNALGTPPQANR